MQESTQNHRLLVYKDFQDIIVMQEINCICKPHFFLSESVHTNIESSFWTEVIVSEGYDSLDARLTIVVLKINGIIKVLKFCNALLVEPIASKYGSRGVVLTSARFHSDD